MAAACAGTGEDGEKPMSDGRRRAGGAGTNQTFLGALGASGWDCSWASRKAGKEEEDVCPLGKHGNGSGDGSVDGGVAREVLPVMAEGDEKIEGAK